MQEGKSCGKCKFLVEMLDYRKLVLAMDRAGYQGMADILNGALAVLPKPIWENERKYFFAALYNASRPIHTVRLWLEKQPHLRPQITTDGIPSDQIPPALEVPVIGGEDDALTDEHVSGKTWSDEQSIDNFRMQAEDLERHLQEVSQKNPDHPVRTVKEYVENFRGSAIALMTAQVQLAELGYLALATGMGIQWLIETYPPKAA